MSSHALSDTVTEAFAGRVTPIERLADSAEAVAAACLAMAGRFQQGGRLLVFGNGNAATDAQHVSVEFMHPVIVGKPALPAFSLVADTATVTGIARARDAEAVFEHQIEVLGRSADIAFAVSGDGECANVGRALIAARRKGLLTVALVGGDGGAIRREGLADHCLVVEVADRRIVKEGHVTLYHVLWELVHVFGERPELLSDAARLPAAAGIAGLYPFLFSSSTALAGTAGLFADATGSGDLAADAAPTDEADPAGLLADVARSVRDKVAEIVELRRHVGAEQAERLAACASALADSFASGGTLLAFGNGGSSTDAQDVAHTFLDPEGGPGTRPLPALCLTSDAAVVTALSNDVGFDVVFARQVRAVGRPGDIAVGVSTSGGSANVLDGLRAAKQAGMTTVGFSGYGGGKMAEAAYLDHLFAVPSSSVHRVQEVQTTLYHVLWEAVQTALTASRPDPAPHRPPLVRD